MDKFADFWDGMQAQEKMSKITDERRAAVGASLEAIQRFGSFLRKAENEEERDLRLDLLEGDIKRVSELFADKHDVAVEPVVSFVRERLSADVAVTEPDTIDPEKEIGGDNKNKYPNTLELDIADAKTDVNELTPVLEKDGIDEPVNHKLESIDMNKDTQKSRASAVSKTAWNDGDYIHGGGPTVGAFTRYLQTQADPGEQFTREIMTDLLETFMAEYEATPEQFEDY